MCHFILLVLDGGVAKSTHLQISPTHATNHLPGAHDPLLSNHAQLLILNMYIYRYCDHLSRICIKQEHCAIWSATIIVITMVQQAC